MQLREFLNTFFSALASRGVRYCILRNHSLLPDENVGGDIDILMDCKNVGLAVASLQSIPGIRITGHMSQAWAASIFVEGVMSRGKQTIQLDFIKRLYWKGFDYLNVDEVLSKARARPEGPDYIVVPAKEHEAVNTFFASYLVGGFIKDRYFEDIRKQFLENREPILYVLGESAGTQAAQYLVALVLGGSCAKLMEYLPRLKAAIVRRRLGQRPWSTARSVVRHFYEELSVRFRNAHGFRVSLISPSGCIDDTLFEGVQKALSQSCKKVIIESLENKNGEIGVGVGSWLCSKLIDNCSLRRELTIVLYRGCPYLKASVKIGMIGAVMHRIPPTVDLLVFLDDEGAARSGDEGSSTMRGSKSERDAYLAYCGRHSNSRVVSISNLPDVTLSNVVDLIYRDLERYFGRARRE